MGKCPPTFYGLTDEYCVKCWNYNTDAAPDSPIMLANCSGIYDASIQVWKGGKQVTVGGTVEPVARFGSSIWPPNECASGECSQRSYKGLLPQESGISLVPDKRLSGRTGKESKSCLPSWDEATKEWALPSMICDAATKAGETCHPLRAYGKFSMPPDDTFKHEDRNLHAWPPHRGNPPTTRQNCTKHAGIWAAHAVGDSSSRTNAANKKVLLPDACAKTPYVGAFAAAAGAGKDKKTCRAEGGAWANVDANPATCGTGCAFECRMPCCLSIFEDGPPMYVARDVDKYPGGSNEVTVDNLDETEDKGPLYEFLGKRPVCSRANPCEPKFACLGGDVCLEGYVKYYEPYVKKDGEYVCQNFHYKLPGSCPSPIVTWGPISGWTQFDDDFVKKEVPNFHAYLISTAFAGTGAGITNSSSGANLIEGSFDFQSINPQATNYREKWCEETPENARYVVFASRMLVSSID
jgi:hypothetical protein